MSAAAVRRRNQWTVQEKYKIIQAYERKTEVRIKSTLVREFDLPSISSLNSILAKKDEILHNFTSNFTMQRKRFKPSTFPEFDQELYQWFLRMRANKVKLSCDLLIHQAKLIAVSKNVDNFKASKGFVEEFKSRCNLVFKKHHGEGAAVNTEVVDEWFAKIRDLIAEYSPNDIFNWDESGLFYTETRNASLVTAEEKKERNLRRSKQQKQRITVLVGASMSGEKLPLIVVGKYEKPRVLKNARVPVEYHAQKSA